MWGVPILWQLNLRSFPPFKTKMISRARGLNFVWRGHNGYFRRQQEHRELHTLQRGVDKHKFRLAHVRCAAPSSSWYQSETQRRYDQHQHAQATLFVFVFVFLVVVAVVNNRASDNGAGTTIRVVPYDLSYASGAVNSLLRATCKNNRTVGRHTLPMSIWMLCHLCSEGYCPSRG